MSHPTRTDTQDENEQTDSVLNRFLGHLAGVFGARNDGSLRESLEGVLEEHEGAEASLTPQERLMLTNILSFNDLRVDDVMVPRADILAVDESLGLQDVLKAFSEAAHSRLPVFRETLDDPSGMYHIKDVIRLLMDVDQTPMADETAALKKVRRPLLYVPASMPAIDLLLKMQQTHNHLALVIDEYGGTDGLVSIEDLVQEIVGEMEDSPSEASSPALEPLSGGGYDADARVAIEDFEAEVNVDLLPDERDEDLDTLGGLVVSLVGRVPQRGEIIVHSSGLEFEVLDADPRRLKRLRIRSVPASGEPSQNDTVSG